MSINGDCNNSSHYSHQLSNELRIIMYSSVPLYLVGFAKGTSKFDPFFEVSNLHNFLIILVRVFGYIATYLNH